MNDLATQLTARVRGRVLLPGTDGYDDERSGFQRLDPHRPAVVVAAACAEDVRAAVEAAAAHRRPLAVQAAGHGLAAPTGGVLVSTRRMCAVRVDPRARTAWVAAGATWRHVIEAAAPHGLAPLSGSFPDVGAVPYTLGGGGGNFGVVTGMEIGLVPVSRIYGGSLFFDVARVPDVLDGWRRWTADLPEELTSGVTALTYPDLPVLPEPLRGRQVAQVQIAFLGSAREGRRLVEPLRSLGPVLRDTLRDLPYTESGTVFDEPDRPHAYRSQNLLVRGLAPRALAGLAEAAAPSSPVLTVVGLRHLGGALARAPRTAGAVGHRDAAYSVTVLSPVGEGERETVREVHRAALAPLADAAVGRSLNFSFGPLDQDGVRSAFAPADYERLTRLRARYDPHGLLHANHRVPAAG